MPSVCDLGRGPVQVAHRLSLTSGCGRRYARDPSNITLLGDQLEAAGLAQRQPDPADGRRRVLVLTDKGLALWSRLLERLQQRSALFTLTTDEQNQLLGLLKKVATNHTQIPIGFLT